MPYIQINTSRELSADQKERIKAALGEKLPIIPGKTEAGLMVAISGQYTMFMAGEKRDAAFVDVRCFKKTDPEAKKAFTSAVFEILHQIADFQPELIYLNFSDHDVWGARGQLME